MADGAASWATALSRFGLGAQAARGFPVGDPREALRAELARGADVPAKDLPSGEQALAKLYAHAEREAEARVRAEILRDAGRAMPAPSVAEALIPASSGEPSKPPANPVADVYAAEAAARMEAAVSAPLGFVERLVAFWSNHFCVSAAKGQNVRILAGAFEREAIRPFVLGKFADMLDAVERHPAMLFYLDNVQSVDPDSQAGRRSHRGLNENLAREILELHTLGVDGGYAQADVTEFARALTGWTVTGRDARSGPPGVFVFNAGAHADGARTLLGRSYEPEGLAQGRAVLDDLARSPATARHVARKFARAFVADDPPPGLVETLRRVFVETEGDLGALARALIDDDASWSAPPRKMRDPWEMLVAAHRALGLEPSRPQRALRFLNLLGMPFWTPQGPNGFPDISAAWASPEGLKTRLQVATALGKLARNAPAPADLLAQTLPTASQETRDGVLRAESRPQAYALLIMSPEFQRR